VLVKIVRSKLLINCALQIRRLKYVCSSDSTLCDCELSQPAACSLSLCGFVENLNKQIRKVNSNRIKFQSELDQKTATSSCSRNTILVAIVVAIVVAVILGWDGSRLQTRVD